MKKRLLLICVLLVSVITLSGAANRSFRTKMEQWNPIGFTQAPSESPITNHLTAGSAILPTVATAAPSGVLRGGSENVITFTTAKEVGEEISLEMEYSGAAPTLRGATGTPKSGKYVTYTLTSQTVTITGDVTDFDCSENQLTTLDVSKNTALTRLICSNNQLKALDVPQNTALKTLFCKKNQLTALDVSQSTALKILSCEKNQLTTLDVSNNTALTGLWCFGNQLKALNLSQTALTELNCSYNQLKALDVSQNTALTRLICSNNQLTALDVSQNTALTKLDCDNNQLTALDVSKNTALTMLLCNGNQIKGEEMTRLVNSLPDRTGKTAGEFTVVQEPDLEGNICLKSDVAIAKGKNWNTLKYKSDAKYLDLYEGSPYIISFTTAKAVGEVIWLGMKYSRDKPTLSGATRTSISGTGKDAYTLTSQTVTITGDVTHLTCYNNQLTALDVSQNTALTILFCSHNQLKALDVSRNTALTNLDCDNNQLTALDVSQNTKLGTLDCRGNQIKGEEMTRLVNSLPDRTGKYIGEIVVVQSDAESNRCLKSDVAIVKGKNWSTRKYKSDTREFVAYEGEEPIPYAVTLTKEGEGTITATGAADLNAVPEGTELTIVATPTDGYGLKALTANGTDILATKKFTVRANTEVKAIFAKTYAVTLTKEGEGTLTATGAEDLTAVLYGTELTIVATPAEGYELTALTANSTDILATKKFTVTANTEVKATFTKKTFAVTLTKEGEGTLTATGADDLNAVPYGTELTIEATPAEGYELKALTANGTDILATKKFIVKGATEIKASFTKKTAADVVNGSSVCLYPNPASTYVNVKGAKADALVRLYDANGTLLYEARTDADGTLQIDLSAYAEGTYLLRVGNDAQRLLIQR